MATVLPQAGQKPRLAYGEERYHVGSAFSQANAAAGKCTKASAGAPECLRHIEQ
jgi:hypothetical protein